MLRDQSVSRSKLYPAYRPWPVERNEYTMGKHAFNNHLRERGWKDLKDSEA